MGSPEDTQDTRQTVKVLLFGAAAARAGVRETELPPPESGSLESLWSSLAGVYPELSPMRKTLAFAINGEYATVEAEVSPGDEVAVLPPVSGG